MERRLVVGGLASATLLLVWKVALVHGGTPAPPPTVTIPGVPATGECCVLHVDKRAKGNRTADHAMHYQCAGLKMAHSHAVLELTLTGTGAPCDQSSPIPNGSKLKADGSIIRREDGVAHFGGTFTITSGSSTLFKGRIELMDAVGSHRPAPLGTEPCNGKNHMEGWLVGAGAAPTFTLRAMIAARIDPIGIDGAAAIPQATIDGMIIRCPS